MYATYIVRRYRAGVIVNSAACSVLLFCVHCYAGLDSSVGVYTWYMEPRHYRELRLAGHTTEVVIPLLSRSYTLPVHIVFFRQEEVRGNKISCALKQPDSTDARHLTRQGWGRVTRFVYFVHPATKNSGIYLAQCTAKYYYQPEQVWYPFSVEKEVKLRFVNGRPYSCTQT